MRQIVGEKVRRVGGVCGDAPGSGGRVDHDVGSGGLEEVLRRSGISKIQLVGTDPDQAVITELAEVSPQRRSNQPSMPGDVDPGSLRDRVGDHDFDSSRCAAEASNRAFGTDGASMTIECATPPRARRRRRIRFVLVAVVVAGVLLVAVALVIPYSLYRQIGDADVHLDALPDRPAKSIAAQNAVDVAVLGTIDSRCVSLMVFHISSNRRDAAFVSVPGSPICGPAAGPMDADDPQRVARDLEHTSGVRLDHLAILDWAAVSRLDAVADGVEVMLDGPAYLPWPDVYQTVTPDNLLDFVGYPISSPDQEPARIRKQQLVLQNVLRTTLHQEMRKNPGFSTTSSMSLPGISRWTRTGRGST